MSAQTQPCAVPECREPAIVEFCATRQWTCLDHACQAQFQAAKLIVEFTLPNETESLVPGSMAEGECNE